jgi:methylated-DNA-[protein]-cysteine S-methyltransferase
MTTYTYLDSPIGPLLVTADDGAVTRLHMHEQRHTPGATDPSWEHDPDDPVLVAAAAQLREYFSGERTEFDLPLAPVGTAFQREVWTALRGIPYGETESYGDVARRINRPGSSRAVGLANGRNPIAIVVPCHRVVGSTGALVGYGGGLERKRFLLELERRTVGAPAQQTLLEEVG